MPMPFFFIFMFLLQKAGGRIRIQSETIQTGPGYIDLIFYEHAFINLSNGGLFSIVIQIMSFIQVNG